MPVTSTSNQYLTCDFWAEKKAEADNEHINKTSAGEYLDMHAWVSCVVCTAFFTVRNKEFTVRVLIQSGKQGHSCWRFSQWMLKMDVLLGETPVAGYCSNGSEKNSGIVSSRRAVVHANTCMWWAFPAELGENVVRSRHKQWIWSSLFVLQLNERGCHTRINEPWKWTFAGFLPPRQHRLVFDRNGGDHAKWWAVYHGQWIWRARKMDASVLGQNALKCCVSGVFMLWKPFGIMCPVHVFFNSHKTVLCLACFHADQAQKRLNCCCLIKTIKAVLNF